MHLYNIWFKETNREKRTARVLELFPENTPPAETQPKPTDAPRLIGIGSQYDGTLSLTSFIDSEPVFSEENPFKAMLLLLAIYFVVGIKWPPLVRLPLIFLTCAIGCLSKVRSDVVRNQKFVTFLRQMKAYE
ncbi:uncharacterized protein LOC127750550 [Frankliniella occidentalis]|uniref:Uncharacterized protein LOC127750550 n=1 Tax=Frankliniella occidentalis TaxID=133901 RepID=A0A9C6X3G3_FRAOC|nr:uncharacterized protein LOC127750550 [Frankliniella occidentalis]